jgi:uncharacterized protein (TIGR03435 family)
MAAVVSGAAAVLRAQQPAFEAASIRQSVRRAAGGDWVFRPGGQFIASNTTVTELIAEAYGVETFRVVGAPDWTREAQYDVQARGGANVTMDETRLMLRTLLQERFGVRARVERLEVPIYALVLIRSDGRTGPRLPPAAPAACVDRGEQPINVPRDAPPSCGRLMWNPGRMLGRRVTLDLLAAELSTLVNRVVVNRTGLTNMFDLDLDWTPDSGRSFGNPDAPGLFTALGEQLGLRLDSSRGPADVVVVDAVERPTEN